jgi:tRNA 2-thiouridine synthesizing protein A
VEALTLDVRGQSCPIPVVRAAQAIGKLSTGDTLVVLATDRGSLSDIPSWCNSTGNELVDRGEDDGVFRFVVRKA